MIEEVARVAVAPGFTWTAAGAWASFFALMGLIVRQWVPLKKARIGELESVIQTQTTQIEKLTNRIEKLEQKLDDQRTDHEAQLAFERANHKAELGLQRHATRNAKQILYGILDLIEAAPDKAREHAAKMRDRMKELDTTEVAETATIRGAQIIAAAPVVSKQEHVE